MARKNITRLQKDILLERMEADETLFKARCNSIKGRKIYKEKWVKLTAELNKIEDAPKKSVQEWQRVWTHLKNKIKIKASTIATQERQTGDSAPLAPLTEYEERVANLIGYEVIAGLDVEELGFGDPQSVPDIILQMVNVKETSESSTSDIVLPVSPSEVIPEINQTSTSPSEEEIKPSAKRRRIQDRTKLLERFTRIQEEQTEALQNINTNLDNISNSINNINSTMKTSLGALDRIADAIESLAQNRSTVYLDRD